MRSFEHSLVRAGSYCKQWIRLYGYIFSTYLYRDAVSSELLSMENNVQLHNTRTMFNTDFKYSDYTNKTHIVYH